MYKQNELINRYMKLRGKYNGYMLNIYCSQKAYLSTTYFGVCVYFKVLKESDLNGIK